MNRVKRVEHLEEEAAVVLVEAVVVVAEVEEEAEVSVMDRSKIIETKIA
jgi:hypothetical protein